MKNSRSLAISMPFSFFRSRALQCCGWAQCELGFASLTPHLQLIKRGFGPWVLGLMMATLMSMGLKPSHAQTPSTGSAPSALNAAQPGAASSVNSVNGVNGVNSAPSAPSASAPVAANSADSPLLYDKADRGDKLLAAAKQEGTLTIYTAFRPQDMPTLIAAFEAKTGIKVKYWRSGSDNVVQRIVRESSSKHQEVDLIMTPASEMLALEREHLLQAVYSPHVKDLIAPAQVSSHRSSNMIMNVVVQSYNTNVLKKENLPKSFQDLRDPRFKNNLGIEAKAEEWFSKVVLTMGEDKGVALFKEIAQKNGLAPRLGVSLLHNLVIAGEVPIALTDYIDLPEKDKRAGKPVDWFALDPVVAHGFSIAVAQHANHPNAALLFYDHLLSPETQKLFASLGYYPTNTKVVNPYAELKINVVDPSFAADNFGKWTKLFEQNVTKVSK